VPVIRDVPDKRLLDVAAESRLLVEQALSGQIAPDDLRGGTFTITNLGMYGVETFTPIINLPEYAILGVGAIRPRPVVTGDGQVVAWDTVTLSLTFDHRVVDGAPAARFLQRVKELVERPLVALLA
jgi:pyruvate dehydrogenase E2 component (dihydrolipoamide acetyltransferase)